MLGWAVNESAGVQNYTQLLTTLKLRGVLSLLVISSQNEMLCIKVGIIYNSEGNILRFLPDSCVPFSVLSKFSQST